jgi:hypothetical protein
VSPKTTDGANVVVTCLRETVRKENGRSCVGGNRITPRRKCVQHEYDGIHMGKWSQTMALHPELNGQRLYEGDDPNVAPCYLVMDGKKRLIPNDWTFDRLFRDRSKTRSVMISLIDDGSPISNGALLAKDPDTDPIWFIDHEQKIKRYITSPETMDKYNFFPRQERVSNYVLDAINSGDDIV